MTLDEMAAIFAANDGEYNKFGRVNVPFRPTQRPDLMAFLILDTLAPGATDIVGSAGHDEIRLDADPKAVAAAAQEEDILNLIRCGVRWDRLDRSFAMYA